MVFGIKCAVLTVNNGKRVACEGLELPSGEVSKEAVENGYKYLGVSKTDMVMNSNMKAGVRMEYLRSVKLLALLEKFGCVCQME